MTVLADTPTISVETSVSFSDCLAALPGLRSDDLLSELVIGHGNTKRSGQIRVAGISNWHIDPESNTWVGLSPMSPVTSGRGGVDDVVAVVALAADLDVGPGKLASFADADAVIDELAAMLGTTPAYVTSSGHGRQPVWALERLEDPERAKVLVQRWGRLVKHVATAHGGSADSVFDLARVWRVPGSINWKDRDNPIAATAVLCHGRLLGAAEVEDILDTYLTVEPTTNPRPQEWATVAANVWADGDCVYIDAMISGWAHDTPPARHPWLLSGATRLACARRYGCLTQASYEAAKEVLDQRMAALCAGDSGVPREYLHSEFKEAICWGEERASELTDVEIADQLGGHTHDQGAPFELRVGRYKGIPMGQRFARERLAGRFLLVDARGWMVFDGVKWVNCSEDDVRSEAVEWAEAEIMTMIKASADNDELVACLRYREPRGINDLLAGASTERTIRVKATVLDADPYLLNTPNGAIDLRTGEVVPCSPKLLCTKATGAEYHPDAHSEHWDQALTALPPEVRDFLQLRLGQMLIGEPVPTDEVLFLVGSGENGKSLVLGSVQRAFGAYAVSVPETLLLAHTNQHPTETMQLKGARLALLEELPESRHLNASQLKKIIGTDKLTGRYLYKDFVEFDPSHGLVVTTNYLPIVNEVDHGTWRRMLRVPFPYQYVKQRPEDAPDHIRQGDPRIRERLKGVHATQAVLAWLVAGALRFMQEYKGALPPPPEAVQAATTEWRTESSPIAAYVHERLILDPNAVVSSTELREDFNEYTGEQHPDWTSRTFVERFGALPDIVAAGVTKGESRRLTHSSRDRVRYTSKIKVWRGVRPRDW